MSTNRRCVVYTRLSVSTEESVSIARQIEAAEQYAAAHGWQVVGTFADDGVSATKSKPEDRLGWQALLSSQEAFDAVIIWKIDRLARRITDFWDAVKTLEGQGRSLVSITDSLDLRTTIGQIVAGVLAGFAQMEAESISLRVAAARQTLIREGRVVGGTVPYGWRSVPNPDGPGRVLVQDPGTIGYVRGMVERVQAGQTVYGVMRWLTEAGAPLPVTSQKRRRSDAWAYSSVERLLRHPVLAGMTPFNPGNGERTRGSDVLRNEAGLPVVDETLAVLSVADWRRLVAGLDGRESAQSRPRAACARTSSLLSGLVWCGEHDESVRMHRGTTQGRPGYSCPACHMTLTGFEDAVVEEFLTAKGEHVRWRVIEEVHDGGAALLPEIEARLDELEGLIRRTRDRDERRALQDQQANLLDLRDEKRAERPSVTYRQDGITATFAEDWASAEAVGDRRAVLDDALARITVRRGRPGRRSREQLLARLAIDWKGETGPLPEPDETWL